ncbi:MAG: phage portal protein [Planctomycetales bacterium]
MTNALTRAFANSLRSYVSAKASVSSSSEALLARGPGGVITHRPDLARAQEQLLHFRGWVYAAVRPIAQRIAGQPIHVGKRGRKMTSRKSHQPIDVEPLESHPILDLIHDPNDLMVAWSLIYITVASLELTGRALWWVPDRKKILPIPTSWIKSFEGSTRITSFRVQPPNTGEWFDLPADQCCYFVYPDPADPHGAVAPLQAAGAAVDADESITTSQASMFRRGIHPSHAIIVGKNPSPNIPGGVRPHLTPAQQRQIISAIQKRYSGVFHHGEPLILDGLIEDVKKLSNTPEEMDWQNSGKTTKERILQGFGVNGIIIGQVEGANRASSTEADRHFVEYTLNPKIELISQTMTEWFRWIFNDDALVIWIEPCVPKDEDSRIKWLGLMATKGAITGDELRELSPFDLELGLPEFSKPLGGGGPAPEDPDMAKIAAATEKLADSIKSWDDGSRDIYERTRTIANRLFQNNGCEHQ